MPDLLIHQKLGIVFETSKPKIALLFFVLKGLLFELETILPSPEASLFHAAKAFRVTWSMR